MDSTTPEAHNTQRYLEQIERCVNGRNYDAMPEYYAPHFTTTGCAGQPPTSGPEQEAEQLKAMVDAFPDFRYEIESIIAEDENLAVIARFRGTHLGEFLGIPATGRSVDVPFVDTVRFEDGMLVEYWGVFASRELRRQLGVDGSP